MSDVPTSLKGFARLRAQRIAGSSALQQSAPATSMSPVVAAIQEVAAPPANTHRTLGFRPRRALPGADQPSAAPVAHAASFHSPTPGECAAAEALALLEAVIKTADSPSANSTLVSATRPSTPSPSRGFRLRDAQARLDAGDASSHRPSTADKTVGALADLEIKKSVKAAKKVKISLDLAKFGLVSEAQWLLFAPHRYDDYATVTTNFNSLHQGNLAVVRGKIIDKKLFDKTKAATDDPKKAVRLFVLLGDRYGNTIPVTAFGKPGFAWRAYGKGSEVVIRSKPQRAFNGRGLELPNPEIIGEHLLGKIVPIYPPIKVTKGEKFAIEVDRHLDLLDIAAKIVEVDSGWNDRSAPIRMGELTGFDSAAHMLRSLHRPHSVKEGEKAMRAARLVSAYTLVRKTAERAKAIKMDPRSIINIDRKVVAELKARLPYPLTGDQNTAVDGICDSLREPRPMDGLLSGDVGSGKTISFLIPLVAAFKAGKRVALLTPNLLLISQVARELGQFFPEVPVCTVNGKGIKGDPQNAILVGSTALIKPMEQGKLGSKPDFLVVDEQHKFSVEQRAALCAPHTNKLEATATPIPRTAALATHGAHDLYLLREIPVVKTITTDIVMPDSEKQPVHYILEALRRGEQAAVIYPLVTVDAEKAAAAAAQEGTAPARIKADLDPRNALINAVATWQQVVPPEKIAVLHGKLKGDEKDEVLRAFRAGEKQLLLASIVIEVGVTLPDLKTMVVHSADRFGVVTLHQLRGRLARHGGKGTFILYTEAQDDSESMERLQLMVDNTDGFELAEKDAEIRGYGDLLGIDGDSQSGSTRCLFQGVKIGPREIAFASNLHERALNLGDLDQAPSQEQKAQAVRLA